MGEQILLFLAWLGVGAMCIITTYLVVTTDWVSSRLWKLLAWGIVKSGYADHIIDKAMTGGLSEYYHLKGYMNRWWYFNPTDRETRRRRWNWIPFAIRIHWIKREDNDRHDHNHPWDARTIVLNGWYAEKRGDVVFLRTEGYTGTIMNEDFHRITEVSSGGVWTMFIMSKHFAEWGFATEEGFVPSKDYLTHKDR